MPTMDMHTTPTPLPPLEDAEIASLSINGHNNGDEVKEVPVTNGYNKMHRNIDNNNNNSSKEEAIKNSNDHRDNLDKKGTSLVDSDEEMQSTNKEMGDEKKNNNHQHSDQSNNEKNKKQSTNCRKKNEKEKVGANPSLKDQKQLLCPHCFWESKMCPWTSFP